MTDIVLEHLKRIQADIADIKRDLREVRADVVSFRSMFGEFLKTDARREGDVMTLTLRIERIERRLEINDPI